ncbi:MAG: restriction endonuclease subunit S [Aeriscardovia sp.]|nr:restriction endonuclease subunit S [Aeriscardovia sp.]
MKVDEFCTYGAKSGIKAGDATSDGQYMFFTSSEDESKRYTEYQFDGEGVIMGTGGNATLHYYNGKYAVSTDCIVLIPDDRVRCKYLYYFFLANMPLLEAGFKGAGLKHTNKKYIGNIELRNIPALNVQDGIVEVIDRVVSIIQSRKDELCKLDDLIKARFVEMFGESNPSWPTVTIGDICMDARTGPFGSALHHDEFVDKGIFVLGIDNAVENRFSYNRMRYITEEKYQQLKRYTVHPGDVIITIMGTIGRSAVIPEDMPLAINTKHLACLTPDKTKAKSVFLCSAFQMHPAVQRQLTGNAKGAIMNGLNLGIIKSLKFQLPPLQMQKSFELFYAQVDKSKVIIQKALEEAQLLFDSLMQQYFG